MVPDLGSSRRESTTSKIGFSPGNMQERLTRGTERTTGLMVGYEIMKVSRLLSGEDLVGWVGDPCRLGWLVRRLACGKSCPTILKNPHFRDLNIE